MKWGRLGWPVTAATLVVAIAAGIGLAVLLRQVAASSGERDDIEVAAPQPTRVAVKNGVVLLTLSAAEQRTAGIILAHPAPAPPQRMIAAYGQVLDPAALTALGARCRDLSGKVQMAEARLSVSRAAFERAKLLHRQQQDVSVAQLQAAEGTFAVDTAALDAARAQQKALADSVRQEWGPVIGAAVLGHTALLTALEQQQDYLVKVTLPPGEPLATPAGTAVAYSGSEAPLHLRLLSAATRTDPDLQGAAWLYELPAGPGVLTGLRLTVSLGAGSSAKAVVVPAGAVVWSEGRAWIFVRTSPENFERRAADLREQAPDGGYVVAGLPQAAQIVVRGAQMLLSEEFRAQAPIED